MRRINVIHVVVLVFLVAAHSVALAVTADENLGRWRKASDSQQATLSRVLIRYNTDGLPESEIRARAALLHRCLDDVAGEGALDGLNIAEVAGTCATMLRLR